MNRHIFLTLLLFAFVLSGCTPRIHDYLEDGQAATLVIPPPLEAPDSAAPPAAREGGTSAAPAEPVAQARRVGNALELNAHYGRAWRRVAAALDRMDLVVESTEAVRGYYLVRLPGATSGADTRYRIALLPLGESRTAVSVLDEDDNVLSDEHAVSLLERLLEQLRQHAP